MRKTRVKQVLLIGDYLPRRCGIATFTTDLCESLSTRDSGLGCEVVAMNDTPEGYAYPDNVCFEIEAIRREHYDIAADFINLRHPDVVCVQHEYGIFGGKAGRYLLPMLRQLQMPVVTTLHTVLHEPDEHQKQVLCQLGEVSDHLVVMSQHAAGFLQDIYQIPPDKIAFIHHGIPDIPFADPNAYKAKFMAEGRPVLLTFGLVGPGKGIEYAIDALAHVVKEIPNVLYIILGATHPHVKQEQGEQYRHQLMQRVRDNHLLDNVTFINLFVSIDELREYLRAADIYLSPYANAAQITSGTLAYAVGAGKAVVSTPYWYAEELLAEERGRLAPFCDAAAMGEAIITLLKDDTERNAMRQRAYQFGRGMTWNKVAGEYLRVFDQVLGKRKQSKSSIETGTYQARFEAIPELNSRHLMALTDSTGILQHAVYSVPDPRFGYSTDDQARALMVAAKAAHLRPANADWELLASRYLSFLRYAFDEESLRFGNYLSYQRTWTKPVATEDVHARAVWGLSHVVAYSSQGGHCSIAADLLDRAIIPTTSFSSPRACAFVILAIQTYLSRYGGASSFRREREVLAQALLEQFERTATDDWPWLEESLSYDNARIPQAIIEAGHSLQDSNMLEMGLRALDWLDKIQTSEKDNFVPIGSNGWYARGGQKARFDQQPIEAFSMMDACFAAYRITREKRWLIACRRAFEWFLGRNDLSLALYDYTTGGCRDGLHSDRVNENQGAESTVCFLLSLLRMYELQEEIILQEDHPTSPEP